MIRLKWWTTIAPLLCLSLLTGCWDRTEINDLAFVLAGGFDLAENGQLEATLQIALPTEVPTATSGGRQAGKNDFGRLGDRKQRGGYFAQIAAALVTANLFGSKGGHHYR